AAGPSAERSERNYTKRVEGAQRGVYHNRFDLRLRGGDKTRLATAGALVMICPRQRRPWRCERGPTSPAHGARRRVVITMSSTVHTLSLERKIRMHEAREAIIERLAPDLHSEIDLDKFLHAIVCELGRMMD